MHAPTAPHLHAESAVAGTRAGREATHAAAAADDSARALYFTSLLSSNAGFWGVCNTASPEVALSVSHIGTMPFAGCCLDPAGSHTFPAPWLGRSTRIVGSVPQACRS